MFFLQAAAESLTTVPCILLGATAFEVKLLACGSALVIPSAATKIIDTTTAAGQSKDNRFTRLH